MPATPEQISRAIDRLNTRKKAYIGIPQEVLDDLRRFCRADEPCFHSDPRIHALLEGRREVWLRIMQHIDKETDELLVLFSNGEYSVSQLEGTEYAR